MNIDTHVCGYLMPLFIGGTGLINVYTCANFEYHKYLYL